MKTEDYLGLPWTVTVHPEDDGGGRYFVADVAEIPGVNGYGETDVEARDDLYRALRDVLDAMLKADERVPAPPRWTGQMESQLAASFRKVSRVAVVQRESENAGTVYQPAPDGPARVELGQHAVIG